MMRQRNASSRVGADEQDRDDDGAWNRWIGNQALQPSRAESVAMRATRGRFTIRWLMETTAIIAIACWLFRFSAETWFAISYLLILYFYGLSPLRRLYGFAPVRRFFAGWTRGHLPVDAENRTRGERRVSQGRSIVGADGRARDHVGTWKG